MPTATVYGNIIYGTVELSGFLNTKINIQQIYAEDSSTTKYNRATLEVDAILTPDMVVITGRTLGNGTDSLFDEVKQIISTPHLEFNFSNRGAGSSITAPFVGIGNPRVEDEENLLLIGPYPEVIDWESLAGSNAIRMKWRVVWNYPNCAPYMIQYLDESLNEVYRDYIVSYTEEQEIDINEEGAVVRNLIGNLELGGRLLDDSTPGPSKTTREAIRALTTGFIPPIPLGFNRTQKIRINKNHRQSNFVITDTELRTDNVLFPFMFKCEATHEMESDLLSNDPLQGQGFTTWLNRIEAKFTVRPGIPKAYGWPTFLNILYQRMARSQPFTGKIVEYAKTPLDNNIGEPLDEELPLGDVDTDPHSKRVLHQKHIPLRLRIKDNIFGRDVEFSMEYVVTASLRYLFDMTGMFYPVHMAWDSKTYNLATIANWLGYVPAVLRPGETGYEAPKTPEEQWQIYREWSQVQQNLFGYRSLALPEYSLFVNTGDCETYENVITNKQNGDTVYQLSPVNTPDPEDNANFKIPKVGDTNSTSTNPDEKKERNVYSTSNVAPELSWIKYANSFEFEENNNATMLPSVSQVNPSRLVGVSLGTGNLKDKVNMTVHDINEASYPQRIANTEYSDHYVQTYGLPIYHIRMKGYALRVGFPIPIPSLLGAYKQDNTSLGNVLPAARVGKAKFKCDLVSMSTDYPVYLAMWDIPYAVKGDVAFNSLRVHAPTPANFS